MVSSNFRKFVGIIFFSLIFFLSAFFIQAPRIYSNGISPWPTWQQNMQRTSQSPFNGPFHPIINWTQTCKGMMIGPNNIIYANACASGDLYALHQDGSVIWAINAANCYAPSIGADGTAYMGCPEGKLRAIDQNGSELWALTTTSGNLKGTGIGPDGTIYVNGSDRNFYAVNPDGTLKWSFAALGQAPPALSLDSTAVYIPDQNGNTYAVNTSDGSQRWVYDTHCSQAVSPVVGPDNTIYSACGHIFAIDYNGNLSAEFGQGLSGIGSSDLALSTDGTLYVPGDQSFYAFDSLTGQLKWSIPMYQPRPPAIGANGIVYEGDGLSNVFAISPNGITLWTMNLGAPTGGGTAIDNNGTLYITTFNEIFAIGDLNQPPVANAGLDQTVVVNNQVQLDGSSSFDPDLDSLTYLWTEDLGNPQLGILSSSTTVNPNFTPQIAGAYAFTLIVNDGFADSAADSITITVQTSTQAIQSLIDLVETFNLQQGISNSLDAKLQSAQQALSDVNQNNDASAISKLESFINAVEAQRGNALTNEQADQLIAAAQAIINSLSAP